MQLYFLDGETHFKIQQAGNGIFKNRILLYYYILSNLTDKKNDCLELLKKCEKLLVCEYNKSKQNFTINRLLAITYNNLGCYYRKQNENYNSQMSKIDEKPNVALNYLKKSLMIEVYSIHDSSTIASSHLNICAIFSRLNKHEFAAEHAKIAIELLDLAKNSIIKKEEIQLVNVQLTNERDRETQKKLRYKLKMYKDIMNMLVISYYNLAIEQEYLKQYENSIQTYKAGYEIAFKELGEHHTMTNTYLENINKLNESQQQKEKREFAKIEKRQKIYEEGYHSYIKHHIRIDTNVAQNQANKFFQETYCQKQPKTSLSKIRNTQSISPNSRVKSRIFEDESLKTIDHPSPNLQVNNILQRAQTVLKSRNDSSMTPNRRQGGNKFIEYENQNTHFLYHKIANEDKMNNDDSFLNMMNRTTLKPLTNINNNNNNSNYYESDVNSMQNPIKKCDKLPSISNAYDPKQCTKENTNLSIQLRGNKQQQTNDHIKQMQNYYGILDKKRTVRQKDRFLQMQSNTIDHDNSGYKVLNNHTKEKRLSAQLKQDLIKERSQTLSTKSKQVLNYQNTYDLYSNNTPHSVFTNGNELNQDSIYQQFNININQHNTIDYNNKTISIPTNNTQDKYKTLQTEKNNPLFTEKYNPIYTEKQITITNRQKDLDNLQGQVRKSLNFNENNYSQFDEKQPDEREQAIQECMDKLVDIYQNQNQSIISPDASQDNIQNISPKMQKQINNNQNDTIKNDLGERELIENYFKEYEQHQFNPKGKVINNQIKQNDQNLFKLGNTMNVNSPEYLTPYLQSGNNSSVQKSERIPSSKKNYFHNQYSVQQSFRASPNLFQTNQQQQQLNQSEQDSEVVLIGTTERNSLHSNEIKIQKSQQLYEIQNPQMNKQYIKRPDSHQENGIDLSKRYKKQVNQIRNVDDNIRFYQNNKKPLTIPIQPSTNKNVTGNKLQKNYPHRYASVNPARHSRQLSSFNESHQMIENSEKQARKESPTKGSKQQHKQQEQMYNTIKETNETQQNNLSQILNEEQESNQK